MNSTFTTYRYLPRFNSTAASALTIGSFDGVHKGHQAILNSLKTAATHHGLIPTVMTFAPHPRAFFSQLHQRPELYPAQINTLRDNLQKLRASGAQHVVLQRFNHDFASLGAEQFIEQLLVKGLNTKWLLVGRDFRFGHKRQGSLALLERAGEHYGFSVQTIEDIVNSKGQRISSSKARHSLEQGDLATTEALLGYPYAISGHVIHGQKLGRTLGYPTLNIALPRKSAVRAGVYIVKSYGLSDQALAGVASIGVRPTVEDAGRPLLEVHLLDHKVNAYGKLVKIELLQFVRDEKKFPDLQTMMAAIDNDARSAREYFASHGL